MTWVPEGLNRLSAWGGGGRESLSAIRLLRSRCRAWVQADQPVSARRWLFMKRTTFMPGNLAKLEQLPYTRRFRRMPRACRCGARSRFVLQL